MLLKAACLCSLVSVLALGGCQSSDGYGWEPGPNEQPVLYKQNFNAAASKGDFEFSDSNAWRHWIDGGDGADSGNGALELFAQSEYTPAVRSPVNVSVLRDHAVGSFSLSASMMQTGRDYAHRDMCVFFGFRGPTKYMYAHLSRAADENAHQVFVVDSSPRTPITTMRTDGVDWGQSEWRSVRVVFDEKSATVRVYFEQELVLESDQVPWSGGLIGFGSFDDEGRVDNINLFGEPTAAKIGKSSQGG